MGSFYNIEITITDECNFRCTYCFEGDGCAKSTELTCVPDVFESIDKLLQDEWFKETFDEGIKIGFWGGEATLRPDILKQFAEKYKDNEHIRFHIYTNGYVMDEFMDIFECCKDKIDVQVSYDGEKIHDMKRFTVGQSVTAKRVRENIYKLHERGFSVGIKSTVTYDTLMYLSDSWEDIRKINEDLGENIKYPVTFDYINDVDKDMDLEYVKKCFIDVARKDFRFYKDKGYHLFTWFNVDSPKHCMYFKYGMAINTNGELSYCHGCEYSCMSGCFKFGHITDDDLLDKIKYNYDYFTEPEEDKCGDCLATYCSACNVTKYQHSEKEDFLDRWNDKTCQKNQCEFFVVFGKVSRSLKDLIRRKM